MHANPSEVVGVLGDEVIAENISRSGSEIAASTDLKKKGGTLQKVIKDKLCRLRFRLV